MTLHIINIGSVVLAESIGYFLVRNEQQSPESKKINGNSVIPQKITEIHISDLPVEEKIRQIYDFGFFDTQKEIADLLEISPAKVSRVLKTVLN